MADFNTLLSGFNDFRREHYDGTTPLMPRLVEEGQNPDFFIISCIDSRSNTGTIFQAPPGTFFAHKAMGAIVRPYKKGTALAAALQFALNHNKVDKLIVLGHTGCGAIQALIEELDDPEIKSFVTVAQEGLEKAKEYHACAKHHDHLHRHAEEQIALLSMKNLHSYPSVQQALDENRLEIACWLFDMEDGNILGYDKATERFQKLTA